MDKERSRETEAHSGHRFGTLMGAVGILMWGGLILFCFLHRQDITVDNLLGYTPENPWLAAPAVVGMFALKSISMVFSVDVLYAMSGILFPLPAAILVNLAGTAVMLTIPYLLGKKTGSRAVGRILERFPKAAVIREMRADSDFLFVLLVRFIGLPCDPVSMYMGAAGVAYGHYLAASMTGLLPHVITFPILGTSIADPLSPRFLAAFGVQIAFTVASLLAARHFRKKKEREKQASEEL